MSKQPWMAFYVNDFQIDTLELDVDEIGCYIIMLCLCWQRKGPLPGDDSVLKKLLSRCVSGFHGHTYNRIVPKLLQRYFYRDEEGNWRQSRIEKELQKSNKLSAKQSQNVSKRWTKQEQNNLQSLKNKDFVDTTVIPSQSQSQSQSHINKYTLVNADAIDEPPTQFEKVKRIKNEKNVELIQNVVGEWNNLASNLKLPQVAHITPARQSNILRRAKELVDFYDYPEPSQGFQALFQKIRGSPFLRGDTGKFRADLDFAINQSSFTKIMEDRYEGIQRQSSSR
jgi:uncharacterized protein YdaU (DUF1376 family)